MIKFHDATIILKGDTSEDVGVNTLVKFIRIFNSRNSQINNTEVEIHARASLVEEADFLLELPELYELVSEQVPYGFEFRELIVDTSNLFEAYYDNPDDEDETFFVEGKIVPATIEFMERSTD